jgi:hypothetical protein
MVTRCGGLKVAPEAPSARAIPEIAPSTYLSMGHLSQWWPVPVMNRQWTRSKLRLVVGHALRNTRRVLTQSRAAS